MTENTFEVGSVVLAKAGRDKGKAFIIVGTLSDEYALIANGTGRSIDKPKKKKLRHLALKPHKAIELKEKIEGGRRVFDAEIRKSLKSFGYEG